MSMKISGFSSFRVETEWPCAIDINRDDQNLLAQIHLRQDHSMRKPWQGQMVRILYKDSTLGIFVSPYPDADPPEWWRDAVILWRYDQIQSEG